MEKQDYKNLHDDEFRILEALVLRYSEFGGYDFISNSEKHLSNLAQSNIAELFHLISIIKSVKIFRGDNFVNETEIISHYNLKEYDPEVAVLYMAFHDMHSFADDYLEKKDLFNKIETDMLFEDFIQLDIATAYSKAIN